MTLNGRYALYCTKHVKMCILEPTTKIWMKIDPYYQRQKMLANDSSFWRYKVYADIRGGSLGRGIKRQWGRRQQQFSALSLAIFFRKFQRWREHWYIAVCIASPAFQWSQNAWPWMTLNGYFALNSVSVPVWLTQTVRLSKNNCMKTNKERHILSAAQILDRDSSFWQYKFCADIRAGSLERRR